MRYTKTAIGLLTAQYRSVLKKCWLINVGLFALGASLISAPSDAEARTYYYASNNLQPESGTGTGLLCLDGNGFLKYAEDANSCSGTIIGVFGAGMKGSTEIPPYSMALGRSAIVRGAGAVAIGNHANAATVGTIAIGGDAAAVGAGSITIGGTAGTFTGDPSGNSVFEVGYKVREFSDSITDLDEYTKGVLTKENQSAVSGVHGALSGYYFTTGRAVSIGADAAANSEYSLALGAGATAGIATAYNADSNPDGYKYSVEKNASDKIISVHRTDGAAMAIGYSATATGFKSAAIGYEAQASHSNALALGTNANASDVSSIALGLDSLSSGDGAVAIGVGAKAKKDASVSIGMGAVSAHNAIGIGRDANASGEGSFALGHGAEATGRFAVAIGNKENGDDTNMHAQSYITASADDGGYAQAYAELRDFTIDTTHANNGTQANVDTYGTGYEYWTYYTSNNGPIVVKDGVPYSKLIRRVHAYDLVNGVPSKVSVTYYWGDDNYGDGADGVYGTYYVEGAGAAAKGAVAVGNMAQAGYVDDNGTPIDTTDDIEHGIYSIAMGYGAITQGDYSIAQGYSAQALGAGSAAIGTSAIARGDGSVAIGQSAHAIDTNTIALGYNAAATGTGATAIGFNTETKPYSNAIGYGAKATGKYSTAIGGSDSSTATISDLSRLQTIQARIAHNDQTGTTTDEGEGVYKFVDGTTGVTTYYRKTVGVDENVVDSNGDVTAVTATRYESGATIESLTMDYLEITSGVYSGKYADASNTIIYKNAARAFGDFSIALGNSAYANGYMASAIGYGAQATNSYATAIGINSRATNSYASAFGYNARASGSYSTAIGYNAQTTASYATAIGYNATASGSWSSAIGNNAILFTSR